MDVKKAMQIGCREHALRQLVRIHYLATLSFEGKIFIDRLDVKKALQNKNESGQR